MADNGEKDFSCSFRIYDHLPPAMIMVQGWFNDQHQCFELFVDALTSREQSHLFSNARSLKSAKTKYKQIWDAGDFTKMATRARGVHKLPDQLSFGWFSWWAACVSNAAADAGGLDLLLKNLGTVESAHDVFRPWYYKTKKVRNLNAADAARILARYGHLQPEMRPLLARGSLRGAAILLNDEPESKNRDTLEAEYAHESSRQSLEMKAAEYIRDCREFARFGKWKMEVGESWFCEVVHKKRYPEIR